MITTTQAIDQKNTRTTLTECNDRPQVQVIRNGNDDRRAPLSGPMAAKCIESGCLSDLGGGPGS